MNVIILSIIVLGIIGIVGAAVLFVVARRFHVQEDPRIDEVEALLPGANCGGCGRSGCRDFAAACVCADTLDGLNCPSSSTETMKKIGEIVGLAAVAAKPKIAVIKCNGTCDLRPSLARFEGAPTCSVLASLGTGESACPSGCLGCGDCVTACPWGAMRMNPEMCGLRCMRQSLSARHHRAAQQRSARHACLRSLLQPREGCRGHEGM